MCLRCVFVVRQSGTQTLTLVPTTASSTKIQKVWHLCSELRLNSVCLSLHLVSNTNSLAIAEKCLNTAYNNNNNNTNTNDNVYGAVIVTRSLREFTRFIWCTQTSARWPPTLRPGQPTWAASPPVHHTSSPFYYYSAQKLILILPSHGEWKGESTWAHSLQPYIMLLYSTTLHIYLFYYENRTSCTHRGKKKKKRKKTNKQTNKPKTHTMCQ